MTNFDAIKKYVFSYANSNMYIIVSNKKALIIDPNVSAEAMEYLISERVSEIVVLLTHEHYDHTSGLNWICSKFRNTVICHSETAKSLENGRNNRPIMLAATCKDSNKKEELRTFIDTLPKGYRYTADITFSDEYKFEWQGHFVNMTSTPGHSLGSCCIAIDNNVVATGDSLIKNTPIITRFPGGSKEIFDSVTVPYLKKINRDTFIIPGHGDCFFYSSGLI